MKFTHGSQEWCGNTFKEIRFTDRPVELIHHSYFDGEGDGRHPLGYRTGDLLEEQLLLTLREVDFADGKTFSARVLNRPIANRAPPPQWRDLTFRVTGPHAVAVPAGEFQAWRVDAKTGAELALSYWFDRQAPHVLIQFDAADGRRLALKSVGRTQYWN